MQQTSRRSSIVEKIVNNDSGYCCGEKGLWEAKSWLREALSGANNVFHNDQHDPSVNSNTSTA